MTLPFHTHTISVLRDLNEPHDLREDEDWQVVSTGIRAVLSRTKGIESTGGGFESGHGFSGGGGGGTSSLIRQDLQCDPFTTTDAGANRLLDTDRVKDEATGEIFEVEWAQPRVGFGLDHNEAEVRVTRGRIT